MRTVYKYPIPRRAKQFPIILPVGFKFLRVNFQGEELMFWAEVDNDAMKSQANFQLLGTGNEVPAGAKWLTTYDDGPFVIHLYQLNAGNL